MVGNWINWVYFVVTMKSSCNSTMLPLFSCNPTSWLWQRLGSNGILEERLSKFLELIEISIVITLGSIEDERTFSTLTYIKNKLKNHFTIHLDMVIRMHVQKFYFLSIFLFYIAIRDWQTSKHRYCVDL
jgi:hypothetical protein